MQRFSNLLVLLVSCVFISACSGDDSSSAESKNDHVWKEQTETINKAKEVEGILLDSVDSTRKAIEEQSE